MGGWLTKLLSRRTGRDGALVELRRDAQALRVDLAERDEQVRRLRAEVEYLRAGEEARTQAALDSLLESLFTGLASPASQLLAQAHILAQGGELRARDVVLVGQQLVDTLEDHGMTALGRAGEETLYDEALHQPLDDTRLAPGARVTVRFPGFRFRGRVVRKAMVQSSGAPSGPRA